MVNNIPATYAKIDLYTGDQRQGKSTAAVGRAVDDYFDHITGIVSPNGEIIKALPLSKEDKELLKKAGVYPNKLKYCHIVSDDGTKSKIIKIPHDYIVLSPVHIFANFHMYGVKYSLISLVDIVTYMNSDVFNDSWILLDESGAASARRSMESLPKLVAEFSATIGKRHAHLSVMAQFNRMVEVYIRMFATTRITCSYDEQTQYVNCDVVRRGEKFSFDFWAPNYWPFFDTTEIIETPQFRIDRALAGVYKT